MRKEKYGVIKVWNTGARLGKKYPDPDPHEEIIWTEVHWFFNKSMAKKFFETSEQGQTTKAGEVNRM